MDTMSREKKLGTLSTGQPSTLNGYREASSNCWGPNSTQVEYIDLLIKHSSIGGEEEVLPSERDMVRLLSMVKEEHTSGGDIYEITEN